MTVTNFPFRAELPLELGGTAVCWLKNQLPSTGQTGPKKSHSGRKLGPLLKHALDNNGTSWFPVETYFEGTAQQKELNFLVASHVHASVGEG